MLKKMTMLFFVMALILGAGKLYAQADALNVGNKICPVTGEKIDEKTKVTYEYQGKIYNFCCAGCPDEFKKDPEKYIRKVNEELQVRNKEAVNQKEEAMPQSDMSSMDMQGGHQH